MSRNIFAEPQPDSASYYSANSVQNTSRNTVTLKLLNYVNISPCFYQSYYDDLKDTIWSPSGAQVLHIVLTFFEHDVKGKVFPLVVSGAPDLLAGSSVIGRETL